MPNQTAASVAAPDRHRRPRDRKAQIVAAAAELFYRRGYHNVGTGEIAAAVGITAGALYRHFSNKQDLLAHTLIDVFTQSTREVSSGEVTDLTEIVAALARRATERRDLGVLWNREARHLDERRLSDMRNEFFGFVAALASALRRSRPELGTDDAELLTWCALGALTSASYHRTELSSAEIVRLLERMAMAVLTTPLARVDGVEAAPAQIRLQRHSRRESLLVAATLLFGRHGYGAVTMEDVGAAIRVSGAAVYKHFDSKVDLLSAAISRASEPLHLGLARALETASTPDQGVANALDAYVDFALAHHDLVGILVSEIQSLPERERQATIRAEHDYVEEWVRLLLAARPEVGARPARFLVHGALTVVNDASRTGRLQRPGLGESLRRIAERVLWLPVE